MEKATRSLEITIISAEGLHINGRSVKKNTLVIVRTDSENERWTSMDREGGSYPSWNQKLKPPLPLPNSLQWITVEVQCKTSIGGIRTVGMSKIPTSDFLGDHTPPRYLHFLSYRLRDRNGERNGIINFSVRVHGSSQGFATAWPVPLPQFLVVPAPAANKKMKISAAGEGASGSGTALGVPVPVPYMYSHGYGV